MNNIEFYPENISKLKELKVCSNTIIGGGDLVKIKNYVPLIIGSGICPRIWLNVDVKNKIFILIKNNFSLNKQIQVIENEIEKSTIIKSGNTIILKCKLYEDYKCIVEELDLRPIGLNIFGNTELLNIAGSKLANNSVMYSAFLIGSE